MYLCCLFHIFNASTDTISYAVRDKKKFQGGGRGQNPVMKTLLIIGIICNFISIQRRLLRSSKHKDIFRIVNNVKTNF